MSAQVNSDGLMTRGQMRDLAIPVGQTAAETVHENNRPGCGTSDDVVDQGHWTVRFTVVPATPARFPGAVKLPLSEREDDRRGQALPRHLARCGPAA
jgi:hypothetical protein